MKTVDEIAADLRNLAVDITGAVRAAPTDAEAAAYLLTVLITVHTRAQLHLVELIAPKFPASLTGGPHVES
jgi:hypothetical protein